MKAKMIGFLLVVLVTVLFTVSPVLAAEQDRVTEWSKQSYNGVYYRYITSYIGMDQWNSYPDGLQFHNSNSSPVQINFLTTAGGPRTLFLGPRQTSEKSALAKDEYVKEISVTITGSPASFLEGTWSGTGYQSNGSSWTIELVVNGNSYNIRYPSLTCGGYWSVNNLGSNSATFREYITFGKDRCIVTGNVTIQQIDATHVNYHYQTGRPQDAAQATLTKVR